MSTASLRGNMATADTLQHLQDLNSLSYLTQNQAAGIDEELMGSVGFSVDQLMELAGLSVATAIAEVYGVQQHRRVLVICGPGNNGGDGLVSSRHLFHFGYKPTILYPKYTDKPIYKRLVTQLENLSVPFITDEGFGPCLLKDHDLVVDAILGFSFSGKARPPFDRILQQLVSLQSHSTAHIPIVSIDIPSGWDVEMGDKDGLGFQPDMLVSLTAPKLCAKMFKGAHHYLGGRFMPPRIVEKYKLRLPPYCGTSVCVRIGRPPSTDVAAPRENYVSAFLFEEQKKQDPFKQFREWFEDAVAAGLTEPNAMVLATADNQGHPYTNYGSRKSKELLSNPWASLVFFWDKPHRQVCIEGRVEKVSDEESDEYFHSRPRGSQIGATASPQSEVVPGRQALDDRYKSICEEYANGCAIPRPADWGGFRLRPDLIEFWQGRGSCLHDRLRFSRKGTNNETRAIERLAP